MNSAQGITISLFLADGSPSGLIVAELKTRWTGKVFNFSQGSLKDVLANRSELDTTGVYLLQSPDGTLYIGEAESIKSRLLSHYQNNKIDFDRATVIISKDDNFTKAHARYLETRLIEIAREKMGDRVENKTKGTPVSLPESERTDMEYYLQQIRLVLPILGLDFLQEIAKPVKARGNDGQNKALEVETLYLSLYEGRIYAEAYETDGQFIIKAGARCRHPKKRVPSFTHERFGYLIDEIEKTFNEGITIPLETEPDEIVILTKDKSFKSASAAAMFVCNSSKNGLTNWKLKSTDQMYGEWQADQVARLSSS
ncbi:MAG: GIY-YIG nuclease family protein [Vampirovibrionales bacterium]